MSLDHVALIAGLAALALLFTSIFVLKLIKSELQKKKKYDAYWKMHAFMKKLDELKIPVILWVMGGSGISGWLFARVAISYVQ